MSRSQYVAVHCVYMVACAPTNKTKSINIADMLADMLASGVPLFCCVVFDLTLAQSGSRQQSGARNSAAKESQNGDMYKMQLFFVITLVALAYVNGCSDIRPAKYTNGMLLFMDVSSISSVSTEKNTIATVLVLSSTTTRSRGLVVEEEESEKRE